MPVMGMNELEQDFEQHQDETEFWDNKYHLVSV